MLTRCTADQESGFCAFGKTEHVEGTHERSLHGFDSIELVMGRRCRAGQMIDFYRSSRGASVKNCNSGKSGEAYDRLLS